MLYLCNKAAARVRGGPARQSRIRSPQMPWPQTTLEMQKGERASPLLNGELYFGRSAAGLPANRQRADLLW
jgi:hypothetical protein